MGLSLALLVAGYKATTVGIVLAAETVPVLILMLAGGVLGDRWSRRSLMIAADLLRFGSQAVLAVLLAIGHPQLGILMGLGGCVGIGNAFHRPAAGGLLPQILPADQLKDGNAMMGMSRSIAIILGPAIGGMLVGFGGGPFAIATDSASYLVSAALMMFVRFPQVKIAVQNASFLTDLKRGGVEFRQHRWLPLLTGQLALVNALNLGMFFVIGPSLFAHVQGGPQSWGIVTSCLGIGALGGSVMMLRCSFSRPLLTIQFCIAIMATPFVFLALHAPLPVLMIGSFVLGIGMAMINTLFQTTMQQTIPLEILSRVSSIIGLVAMCLMPIGYSLSGPAATYFGAQRTIGAGAAVVIFTVIYVLMHAEIRSFGRPNPHAATPAN